MDSSLEVLACSNCGSTKKKIACTDCEGLSVPMCIACYRKAFSTAEVVAKLLNGNTHYCKKFCVVPIVSFNTPSKHGRNKERGIYVARIQCDAKTYARDLPKYVAMLFQSLANAASSRNEDMHVTLHRAINCSRRHLKVCEDYVKRMKIIACNEVVKIPPKPQLKKVSYAQWRAYLLGKFKGEMCTWCEKNECVVHRKFIVPVQPFYFPLCAQCAKRHDFFQVDMCNTTFTYMQMKVIDKRASQNTLHTWKFVAVNDKKVSPIISHTCEPAYRKKLRSTFKIRNIHVKRQIQFNLKHIELTRKHQEALIFKKEMDELEDASLSSDAAEHVMQIWAQIRQNKKMMILKNTIY